GGYGGPQAGVGGQVQPVGADEVLGGVVAVQRCDGDLRLVGLGPLRGVVVVVGPGQEHQPDPLDRPACAGVAVAVEVGLDTVVGGDEVVIGHRGAFHLAQRGGADVLPVHDHLVVEVVGVAGA